MTKKVIEGSHAIAEAVKLCEPGVVAAYPITPQMFNKSDFIE
jgi:pyruvate ferredoxin oxidoreductase alpha subunit